MRLELKKNESFGCFRDQADTIRGFWFSDRERASDPTQLTACAAMLVAEGEKIEDGDHMALTAAKLGGIGLDVQSAMGGYVVMLPSVRASIQASDSKK